MQNFVRKQQNVQQNFSNFYEDFYIRERFFFPQFSIMDSKNGAKDIGTSYHMSFSTHLNVTERILTQRSSNEHYKQKEKEKQET